VVAAAVASLFALELEHNGRDPGPLVPVVFTVVVGTVALVGLSARFAARQLRVAEPDPNGIALIGGGRFAIELADALNDLWVPTLHVGLDDDEALSAAARGQLVYRGRLDSEEFLATARAVGISGAVALSGSDHLDAFASERLARVVGSANVYGLSSPGIGPEPGTTHSVARQALLPPELTAERLSDLLDVGVGIRLVPADGRVGDEGDDWLTLCRVDARGQVTFDGRGAADTPGTTLVQLGPGLGSLSSQA
jgi:hypothetical protein